MSPRTDHRSARRARLIERRIEERDRERRAARRRLIARLPSMTTDERVRVVHEATTGLRFRTSFDGIV
ncbi:hypothetical protein EDF24_1388 [Curtobacterium sp. PhB130]|uniref:hypothetical protein n=1 Tax=unclassified Curtobacterium TaxID=257496 RepID=UPI000FC1CBD2|nr:MULTISPECIES: hypothetical protein [unclassified Curtobacterium]ROS75817.1 hypothetical protein EDF24_1388 [Curtobacterium sp. PhB130]TCK64448.1 hypothetical protein EDF27_1700 [Curtobacterium sp. PhB136]